MSVVESVPRSPFSWLKVGTSADWRVLVAALVGGLGFDWAVHVGLNGLAGAIFFVVLPAALLLSNRLQSHTSQLAIAMVPLFGGWLAIRTSPALLVPDVLCALALFAIAGMWSHSGSLFRTSFLDLVSRALAFSSHAAFVPGFLGRAFPHINSKRVQAAAPVVGGLFIAVPLVVVLGILLISADSVFASFFSVDINLGDVPTNGFLVLLGAWFTATVLRAASCSYADTRGARPLMNFVSAITVVGSMVALYAAFVVTQVVVWAGGAQHALETSGQTYADHARQGFFQLVVVAAITLVVLTTLRSTAVSTPKQMRAWRSVSLIAVLLTLVIVGVAVSRLALYEDAYGLTMLRLYATAFALWIGAVFVLYAVTLFVRGIGNRWFFGTAVIFGFVALFVMNLVNPEALVVHRNVDRIGTSSVPVDAHYLGGLSDDGIAAMIPVFDRLGAEQYGARDQYLSSMCDHLEYGSKSNNSGFAYNQARASIASFREAHCNN